MWAVATTHKGKRLQGGMSVSTQCGLGVLLMLCVARAVLADYSQDMHVQQRPGQGHNDLAAVLREGPSHGHGHRPKYSHGHRTPAGQKSKSQSLPSSNPFHRNTPREKMPVSASALLNSANQSDCDVYLQSHHQAENKSQADSMVDQVNYVLCQYYGPWSGWRPCNRKCLQRRVRKCRMPEQCGTTKLKEHRPCRRKRGRRCSSVTRQALKYFRRKNQPRIKRLLYDAFYESWTDWSACTRSCKQRRRRICKVREMCQNDIVQQNRRCGVPGSRCQRKYRPRPGVTEADDFSLATTTLPTTTEKADVPKKGRKRKSKPKPKKNGKNRPKKEKGEGDEESAGDGEDILWAAQKNCGIRPPAKRGSYRVVGGQEAQRLSWPWQVAVMTRWEEQYCAGTLIAPQWILTAAHCVRKRGRRRRIIVRAGEHNLAEYEGSEQDVKPAREYPHPDFDYATIINDIALVRLRTPIKDHSHPGYACLPDPGFTPDRQSLCYVIGWGKRRNTHLFGAEVLHEARVPLVTRGQCQRMFDYHINTTQMCAGYRRGGRDACDGDSGGPLLCPKTSGGVTRWYLVGITSYGEGCGRRGKYGIYTRVTSYLDWITDTIRDH